MSETKPERGAPFDEPLPAVPGYRAARGVAHMVDAFEDAQGGEMANELDTEYMYPDDPVCHERTAYDVRIAELQAQLTRAIYWRNRWKCIARHLQQDRSDCQWELSRAQATIRCIDPQGDDRGE
jgi:hypothetical protein